MFSIDSHRHAHTQS